MSTELPNGWTLAGLSDVAEIGPTNPENIPSDETQVSFVPMPAAEAGTGRMDPSGRRLWGQVKKGYKRFQDGDVLFAKITPCMENGKTVLAKGLLGGVGTGSTEFHVLRPNGSILPKVLMHYLLQVSFRRDARSKMTGTAGQLRVPVSFLEVVSLPLAPEDEQHRIVEAIESYLTRLDDAVANLERVQRNLKRYRASVLKAAVEGRLVPTEAELARQESRDYEPASVLLERILKERKHRFIEAAAEEGRTKAKAKAKGAGKPWTKADNEKTLAAERAKATKKYKEPAAPDTSKLPELPDGWCWATAEAVTDSARVICYGILKPGPNVESGRHYIKVKHMRGEMLLPMNELPRTTPEIYEQYARAVLRFGDVLLSIRGTFGRVAIVRAEHDGANITQDSARLAPMPGVERHYLAAVLRADPMQRYFKRVARGVAVRGVNIRDIRPAPVPLPPTAEQRRIVAEVDRLLSIQHETLHVAIQSTKRAKRLRQSILKWAFEGKLVDQDPNDEPASDLLERIKAERAANESTKKTTSRGRKRRTA